jgi:hypothetical protein
MNWADEIEKLVEGQATDSVTTSEPSDIVLQDEVSRRSIEIVSAGASLFRMKEDIGASRGGFQTQVTTQLARWSFNGPPITWDVVCSNVNRWLGERGRFQAHQANAP